MKREADSVRELLRAQNDATPAVTVTRQCCMLRQGHHHDAGRLKKISSPKGDILADDRSKPADYQGYPDHHSDPGQSDSPTGP